MSSSSGHHTDDSPLASDFVLKCRKGKVRNPCLLYKGMHFTYLFPCMDEASKLLEDITISRQRLPTCYRNLSLEPPLVDQVVDSVSSVVDPTLPSKSKFQVVNSDSSMVDPTLPFKSEVKAVESMSSPLDPTLSSNSVKTELVALTKPLSCSSLPVENELKPAEVFVLRSDCFSTRGNLVCFDKTLSE